MRYKNIIWDWNGTLFNDIDACIKTMNELLDANKLPCIKDRDQYRRIFCFPVKNYYKALGFDFTKTSFEELANTYISMHVENQSRAPLFDNTIRVLQSFEQNGCSQYVVSATEQKNLISQIEPFSIINYFSDICGIENHFAKSKLEVARMLINRVPLQIAETVFIGDTVHDWEVANASGCSCILIANGHQGIDLLKTTGAKIVTDISQVLEIIRSKC